MNKNWVFWRTEQFRKSFDALSPEQKALAKEKFKLFKGDPFHPSLRVHKINRLTSLRGTVVRAVVLEGNLRAVFEIHGNVVLSLDIGTHDIYK